MIVTLCNKKSVNDKCDTANITHYIVIVNKPKCYMIDKHRGHCNKFRKRKTSCVFSSDNPSFIMITYILLYFSCRTGSAFD